MHLKDIHAGTRFPLLPEFYWRAGPESHEFIGGPDSNTDDD